MILILMIHVRVLMLFSLANTLQRSNNLPLSKYLYLEDHLRGCDAQVAKKGYIPRAITLI